MYKGHIFCIENCLLFHSFASRAKNNPTWLFRDICMFVWFTSHFTYLNLTTTRMTLNTILRNNNKTVYMFPVILLMFFYSFRLYPPPIIPYICGEFIYSVSGHLFE